MDTPYISNEELKNLNVNSSADMPSILHLNIRSIKKNFENFKIFLNQVLTSVHVFRRHGLTSKSLCELPNYKNIHQIRNYGKGGGVFIYIKHSINCKPRPDLSINNTDVESISVELLWNKNRNTSNNVLYRSPKGLAEPFAMFLNCTFHNTEIK